MKAMPLHSSGMQMERQTSQNRLHPCPAVDGPGRFVGRLDELAPQEALPKSFELSTHSEGPSYHQHALGIQLVRVLASNAAVNYVAVHQQLPSRGQGDLETIQWARSRALEVHAVAPETAAMAGTLELVLPLQPVGGAAEVGTAGQQYEDSA